MKSLKFRLILAALASTLMFSSISTIGYADPINEAVSSIEIGTKLNEPEDGWNRYDNNDSNVLYQNVDYRDLNDRGNFMNGDCHSNMFYPDNTVSKMKFSFTGSKFYLINQLHTDGRNQNIKVYIDGKYIENTNPPKEKSNGHFVYYISPDLEEGKHTVILEHTKENGEFIFFDIVDIKGNIEATTSFDDQHILDIEPEKEKIHIAEEVTADLVIDNIDEIAAEDIRIQYDSDKLEYLSCEEIDGIKLVVEDNKEIGELRFILASEGEENIVNAKEVLLKLKFRGLAEGEALIDIIKGRVSDGIEMERDLEDKQCDEATIIIEGLADVNKNGEFTLLDLAIDARHLNKDVNDPELQMYNTDIAVNSAIDEADLLEIGRLILENANYIPNN